MLKKWKAEAEGLTTYKCIYSNSQLLGGEGMTTDIEKHLCSSQSQSQTGTVKIISVTTL